ncbi:MAG: cyclic nucleotide-binding/CBS domain-containing protein [Phycisphaerae bacterium]
MAKISELLARQCDASKVQSISAESTVLLAARKLRSQGIGCLLVVEQNGHLAGVVSERDIVAKVVAESGDTNLISVGKIMTNRVISCSPETSTDQAEKLMAENNIRHLPVVRNNKPVGMVSMRDIMSERLSQAQKIARQQSSLLKGLESQHPGITNIQKDASGRIVI